VDTTVPGFHDSPGCNWRTPCCGKVWTWGTEAGYRLLTIGNTPDAFTCDKRRFAFIGSHHAQKVENTVDFLKAWRSQSMETC
jgi:hypothetical protein